MAKGHPPGRTSIGRRLLQLAETSPNEATRLRALELLVELETSPRLRAGKVPASRADTSTGHPDPDLLGCDLLRYAEAA